MNTGRYDATDDQPYAMKGKPMRCFLTILASFALLSSATSADSLTFNLDYNDGQMPAGWYKVQAAGTKPDHFSNFRQQDTEGGSNYMAYDLPANFTFEQASVSFRGQLYSQTNQSGIGVSLWGPGSKELNVRMNSWNNDQYRAQAVASNTPGETYFFNSPTNSTFYVEAIFQTGQIDMWVYDDPTRTLIQHLTNADPDITFDTIDQLQVRVYHAVSGGVTWIDDVNITLGDTPSAVPGPLAAVAGLVMLGIRLNRRKIRA